MRVELNGAEMMKWHDWM